MSIAHYSTYVLGGYRTRWASGGYSKAAGREPQPQQKGKPSEERSLFGKSRNAAGMHPVNWFPESHSPSRLARLPNSAGIDPVNWLVKPESTEGGRGVSVLEWQGGAPALLG